VKAGDGDRTRTKSLEDPCVPSRPVAWSPGEAQQSGNSQRGRPRETRREHPGHPLVTATVTTSLLRANPGSARRGSAPQALSLSWECGTLIRWTSGWPALVRSRERGSVTRIVIALASRPLRARDRVSARVPLAHAKRGSRPAVANSRSLVGVRAFLALVARRGQGGRGLLGHLRKSASRRLATTADGTITTASSVWDEVVAHTLPRSADLAPPRPSVPVRSRRGRGACDPVNGHAAWSSAP
jgi:hypothetical protein